MNQQRKIVIAILIIAAVLVIAFLINSFYSDRFINLNNNSQQSARVDLNFEKNRAGVAINESLS